MSVCLKIKPNPHNLPSTVTAIKNIGVNVVTHCEDHITICGSTTMAQMEEIFEILGDNFLDECIVPAISKEPQVDSYEYLGCGPDFL